MMFVRAPDLACALVALSIAFLSTSASATRVTKGEKLSQARKTLLAEGWKPRETFGVDANGSRWSQFADAGEMYRAGITEVESCSGTGMNYCSFNYSRKGKCLSVQTRGEFKAGVYEPTVIGTSNQCPKPETAGGASPQPVRR